MANKPIEEYIIKLTPSLDMTKYEEEKQKLQKALNKDFSSSSSIGNKQSANAQKDSDKAIRRANAEALLELRQIKKERELIKLKKEKSNFDKLSIRQKLSPLSNSAKGASSLLGGNTAGAIASFGKVNFALMAIFGVLKIIKDYTEKIVDESTKLSNSLISGNSAFVDQNTRSTMATFGVGSMTAMGINNALSLMGISRSDMATMTGGQMQFFSELMQQWTEGMSSIDKSAISEYNEYMQSFQKDIASIKLDAQIEFYKYLVNNRETINLLMNSVTQIFSLIMDFATGSTGQQIMTLLTQLSTFVIQVLTMSFELISILSPILDIILSIANVVMSVINIIYSALNWVLDKLSGLLDFLGIDISPATEAISSGSNYIYDSAVSGSGTNYNGNGNYGTITITQTTNNSFTGSDSNSYAVANSMAQSQQTWLSRQLATNILE